MSTFISHLESIVHPDLATLEVIAVLCAIAAYAIKEYLAHPPMIVFVYPGMIFCALTAYYLFVVTEQFNTKKLDQWLMWAILASICGTVIGIILVSLLAAFREKVGSRRPPPDPPAPRARPFTSKLRFALHPRQVTLGLTGVLRIEEPLP